MKDGQGIDSVKLKLDQTISEKEKLSSQVKELQSLADLQKVSFVCLCNFIVFQKKKLDVLQQVSEKSPPGSFTGNESEKLLERLANGIVL